VPLAADGPAALFSPAPLAQLQALLLAEGIPARLSLSAGAYLCNALSYTALRRIRERGLPTQFLFVHIPYTPAQVAAILGGEPAAGMELHQRADLASMDIALVIRALRLIGSAMAAGTGHRD
jgi:pyroglutamyl-peptidase